MADEETPRTLIQGLLRTADTNQGIILQRKRKSLARTPKALPSRNRANQSYPGYSSSSKKQKLAQQELVTPRHLIESYVAGTKTSDAAYKRIEKRRSSLGLVKTFDPIADNFTPRTNIAGFLEQALEETPIERELKRRSSHLPAIPAYKSIHLSHDFSSNVDYEHEVSVNSARRRSIRRSLANKTTLQQFKKGVQQGNAESPNDNIVRQIPDIPFNKSIHIEFSDIEADELDINTPSQRPVRKRTKNRTNFEQFSQGLSQKGRDSYKEKSSKDYRQEGKDDNDVNDGDNSPDDDEEKDGVMADLSGNESSGESGVSGVSPRKSSNRSLQLSRLSQNNASTTVPGNDYSPVIANQSVTKALRKSLQNSANRKLSESINLQETLSPPKSSRLSQSRDSPHVMKKSIRRSIMGQSPNVMEQSSISRRRSLSRQSSNTTEKSAKSPRQSLSEISPQLKGKSRRSALEAEEVVHNSEDEEDEDATELDSTDDKYKLITPYLQPRGNRPSLQLSEHRSPLRESSINRPAPAAKIKKVPSKSHNSRQNKGDNSEWFWKQIATDLESYALHAGRKIIDETDVELLMKRQRFVTDKQPLNVLVEKHLPLELRQEIIPMATSGNKVVPL
ncbi:hypothetical protein KUTeg_018806 [Tegillarca granosa]|uniref:CENP-T/Histone H4 histone fold domain-containing protein n=1 Tax=Tegillarca granosa TaxID=220873 RepID=A0ABQ9EFX4_TEGGR|nr:hypothetical protein KUTeg_018806 [Tegillarca granosa]